jgi:hypothetical protein
MSKRLVIGHAHVKGYRRKLTARRDLAGKLRRGPDTTFLAAAIFPRAPIIGSGRIFPVASYQAIKNQVGDEEKAFPILV